MDCRTNLTVTMYRGSPGDPELPGDVERELGWCEVHGEIHSRLVLPSGGTFFPKDTGPRLTLVPRAQS